MATTVYRLFHAIAAVAMVLGLLGCGGGDEASVPQGIQVVAVALTPERADTKRILAVPESRAGVRFNLSTTSVALSSVVATPETWGTEMLLNWAERTFPETFPEPAVTQQGEYQGRMYEFRHYSNGCYVAVRDDQTAWGLGPCVGSDTTPYYFGPTSAYRCLAEPDYCRPKVNVVAVTPAPGAASVPRNAIMKVPFDRALVCPEAPIVADFGVVRGQLTCATANGKSTVTITPDGELPNGAVVTATLSGFFGLEGVVMTPYTWQFTVVKTAPVVKIVTANWDGYDTGAVSIIDPTTRVVNKVMLDKIPGYLISTNIAVDNARGVAYMGALSTYVLHRVDIKTGKALPSFVIDPGSYDDAHWHGIRGLSHNGDAVCIVTGSSLNGAQAEYYARNRLACYSPSAGTALFMSPTDFLGDGTMIPMKLIYSSVHKKFYVLMSKLDGLFMEWFGDAAARDGYRAGTIGKVVEIDGTTFQKGRTWAVGSVPIDGELHGDMLSVVNAGGKTLSKINLLVANPAATGAVTTVDWTATFTGMANPTGIKIDSEKNVYYVPDWVDSIRVMSLTTDQQVGRIITGDVPWGMGIVGGSLWVTAPKKQIFASGDALLEIDRTTQTIKNTVTAGAMPHGLAIYQSQ